MIMLQAGSQKYIDRIDSRPHKEGALRWWVNAYYQSEQETGMASRHRTMVQVCIVLAGALWLACGTKTDTSTGMRTGSSGLSCRDAAVTLDGVKLASNEIPMGKKLVIRYDGVKGFKELGGRVYPGVSMSVTDQGGGTVGEYPDLFKEYYAAGMEPKKAGRISATLMTGKPMKIRAEYLWRVRVWDRKGGGEIVSEMKIKMI